MKTHSVVFAFLETISKGFCVSGIDSFWNKRIPPGTLGPLGLAGPGRAGRAGGPGGRAGGINFKQKGATSFEGVCVNYRHLYPRRV